MVFKHYNALLKTHPYKTNMVTTGILFGTGDVLAQYLFPNTENDEQNKPHTFNYPRTLRAIIYGSIFFAPVSVKWHAKTLPFIKNPFISLKSRATWSFTKLNRFDNAYRLAIDQFFGPIIVWIPMYNIAMSFLALHEHPLDVAIEKLRENYFNVLFANWTVWPIFQLFNIFYVPIHLRIVCSNFWSIGWNCFLSYVHNTSGHGKGSGKIIEELVDIEDDNQEQTMIYQ